MKKATLILLLVLLSGCSTTLHQQWYDMRAYYNTFYNAKSYFEQGLEENLRNQPEFNPHELIRIHPPPGQGGEEAFGEAIEKAASILRNHPNSSFPDDALELIGKSWYYRGDYFAARDKFREVARTTTRRDAWERAVIWEARTYLELGLNSEGIRFLEQMIGGENEWSFLQDETGEEAVSLTSGWTPEYLAQARAVLAQLYTARGDYYLAGLQLLFSLERLEETDLAHRAYFHYGQLMERMGNYTQALSAYDQLLELTPDMEMEFQTLLKRVEALRAMGREEEALAGLYRMDRSELWVRRRPEIRLQLAQTEMAMGGTLQAQYRLESLLRDEETRPDPPVRARVYHELALLHHDLYGDHLTAAAYYDSTARMQVPPEQLPGDWDADELAGSWRTYTELRQEEMRLDSLLTLSRLPRDRFYERIRELEAEHQAGMDDEPGDREPTRRGGVPLLEPTGVSIDTEGGGFLNERNPVQMERGRQQFRQVWGHRPLTDEWRRASAGPARGSFVENVPGEDVNGRSTLSGEDVTAEGLSSVPAGGLNLGEIPGSEQEQMAMEIDRYEIIYRIGVHYLVRLDEPEQARAQFLRVWQEAPEGAPRRESLYALADLAISRGRQEEALRWADELIKLAPASPHARQLAARLNLPDPAPDTESREPE
ncbi:MAG: tetratricopeptide repeat protein [Balneolaceae bacterium]